jgi:hypothetical protein
MNLKISVAKTAKTGNQPQGSRVKSQQGIEAEDCQGEECLTIEFMMTRKAGEKVFSGFFAGG